MLSANKTAGFLNQLYLKKKENYESAWFLAKWYRFEKHKRWFVNFSRTLSNKLPANQISEFLNKLYFKTNWVNQCYFFHIAIDWRKIKSGLKIFNWVWSEMLMTNQILRLLNNYISRATGSASVIFYMQL